MKFLLDAMLGALATYLRICGHDAAYALDRGIEADDRLLAWARAEDRLLVTRDAALAARAGDRGLPIERREVLDQLRELRAAGVPLALPERPTRCGSCNGVLDPVPAGGETPAYAPDPAETDCYRCRDCGQVFWRGSHWDDVGERLASL
ncbi:MAG: Mut7-C RNAse domain-containing protein [Haloferacaceae archaeon]